VLRRTLPGRSLPHNISTCTSEWLSFPRPSAARTPRRGVRASRGRVPEVSLHTAVKGQFGLGTGRAMGKALKKEMFLGKLYRKKRALPLCCLPTPKKKPPPDMTWRPPVHNAHGIERNLYECVFRAHAASCGCGDLVGHISLLAQRYGAPPRPPAPGAPRPQIRRQLALPAPPANPQQANPEWPGGDGGDDGAGGPAAGGVAADADYQEDELNALFDAVEQEE
jgi:hypothetical protein